MKVIKLLEAAAHQYFDLLPDKLKTKQNGILQTWDEYSERTKWPKEIFELETHYNRIDGAMTLNINDSPLIEADLLTEVNSNGFWVYIYDQLEWEFHIENYDDKSAAEKRVVDFDEFKDITTASIIDLPKSQHSD